MTSDGYRDYGWQDAEHTCAHDYLLEPIVREVKRWPLCERLVDAGCGNGAVARALAAVVPEVYAFDLSSSGVGQARATLGAARVAEASVYDDWQTLFAGVEVFDGAVSTEVVEHLYDPRAFVRRAFAALRPGGHLLLTTPYHGYLKNLALALSGKLDAHFTALWDGGHIKFWSRRTLTQLLEEAGFRVVHFEGTGRAPWLWKSMLITAIKPR